MRFNVHVRPPARRQLREASISLELAREELGRQFDEDVNAIIDRISDNPSQFPIYDEPNVRRALIGKFKYVMFFDVRGSTARVLAVLHGHRDLSSWRELR